MQSRSPPPAHSRRTVLTALAAAGLTASARLPAFQAAPSPAGHGLAAAARDVRPGLVAGALDALVRHEAAIWTRDVMALVDFALPSSVPRFHLVDLLAGSTTSLLVAHGRGSDPDHDGRVHLLSNVEGSATSSAGAYLIGETYDGVHGRSRRLAGLDPSNDQAERRAIVIHAADYVGPDVLARQGMLGRSDGCFALSPTDIGLVLAKLGQGRLLYAGA